MKQKIGLTVTNLNKPVGSVVVSMVVVDSNYFRKYGYLKDVDKIMGKVTHHFQHKIRPSDLTENVIESVLMTMISALNTYPEFWKHEINIGLDERFKDLIPIFFTEGLKKKKIDINKWKFNKSSKVLDIAKQYAEHISELDYKDIKAVYGDFGTGEMSDEKTKKLFKVYPDCPHINKKFKMED